MNERLEYDIMMTACGDCSLLINMRSNFFTRVDHYGFSLYVSNFILQSTTMES